MWGNAVYHQITTKKRRKNKVKFELGWVFVVIAIISSILTGTFCFQLISTIETDNQQTQQITQTLANNNLTVLQIIEINPTVTINIENFTSFTEKVLSTNQTTIYISLQREYILLTNNEAYIYKYIHASEGAIICTVACLLLVISSSIVAIISFTPDPPKHWMIGP